MAKATEVPVETVEVERIPEKMDGSIFIGNADENFAKLTQTIYKLNIRAGIEIVLRNHAIGSLIRTYDADKEKKELFGTHKFEEIVEQTNINGETLGACAKMAETWTRDELRDLITRGLTNSHFKRICGFATVNERRQLAEKCITEHGVIPVKQLNEEFPTSKESKAAAGIKDGRGRPHNKDRKPREPKEPKEPDPDEEEIEDPLSYVVRLHEMAEEVRQSIMGLKRKIRDGEGTYEGDKEKEFKQWVVRLGKRMIALKKVIEDKFDTGGEKT